MNPKAPGVAAVVVTHQSASTIDRCLCALLSQSALAEIVLVDNASDDDALARVEDDARIKQIRNEDNPGFAVACNQGARASSADWLLFINPDCFLPPDGLSALLALAMMDETNGIIGAELIDESGRVDPNSRRRDPTPDVLLSRAQRHRADAPAVGVDDGQPRTEAVEAVSGALMLMPRHIFEAVGGFDPGYRLHFEDLDLCRRVRRQGYRVALASGIRVTHLKGVSSRRRPIWVEWQKHLGMLRYFRKFDLADASYGTRLLLLAAVALRFPAAAARAWWRARISSR